MDAGWSPEAFELRRVEKIRLGRVYGKARE